MANKKSKTNRPDRSTEIQEKKRTRMLQIIVAVFSILLILSMILSLTTTF
jgi:hypothetical protein